MKEILKHDMHRLRHRFVEDTNAPIQVLEDPYFMERVALFDKDFGTVKAYDEYVSTVTKTYGDNITQFLEDYHSLRDKIIASTANSDAFKAFNSDESITSQIKEFKPIIGEKNLYTQGQIIEGDNAFLSIDLRKANFQALRTYNPAIFLDCNTYEEFIGKFTDSKMPAKSKRTRQIIFGKLNPHRTMRYEKILVGRMEEALRNNTDISEYFNLFSMNSDELIYKLKPEFKLEDIAKKIINDYIIQFVKTNVNLDVKAEFFHLHLHAFKTADADNYTYVYTKDFLDGSRDFKSADKIYFAQTYKLINGIDVEDNDLVFYYNKSELAKFLKPLVKVS